MKHKREMTFTSNDELLISEAIKLANPIEGAVGTKYIEFLIKNFLIKTREDYPKPGFPKKHQRKHQKAALELVIDLSFDLLNALIELDDECLKGIAVHLAHRPVSKQNVKHEEIERVGTIALPYLGGALTWALRDLQRAALSTLPTVGSLKLWRSGESTKNIFVNRFSVIWEVANPKNKSSGYINGKYASFLELLYEVAYPEDKTTLDRAIKDVNKSIKCQNLGTELKEKRPK